MHGRIKTARSEFLHEVLFIFIGCVMVFLTFLPGSAEEPVAMDVKLPLEETYGVSIVGVKLSGNGYLVDFRYRVIDPGKASALVDRKATPYLVDLTSGRKLAVPTGPRVGSLRAKGAPAAGKTYFILFSNGQKIVKKGSKVDVLIGDFRAEGLTVE